MIYAARIDKNQKNIVSGLRKHGASVLVMSQLKNCFDILVGFDGRTHIMEIKSDWKSPLTKGEKEFKEAWMGGTYHVIYNLADAIKIISK